MHIAILYPNRRELVKALKRVLNHGHDAFTGGQHTPAGEAVYLEDPDGNGLELYYDGPHEQWTEEEGKSPLDKDVVKKLDSNDLLEELGPV